MYRKEQQQGKETECVCVSEYVCSECVCFRECTRTNIGKIYPIAKYLNIGKTTDITSVHLVVYLSV